MGETKSCLSPSVTTSEIAVFLLLFCCCCCCHNFCRNGQWVLCSVDGFLHICSSTRIGQFCPDSTCLPKVVSKCKLSQGIILPFFQNLSPVLKKTLYSLNVHRAFYKFNKDSFRKSIHLFAPFHCPARGFLFMLNDSQNGLDVLLIYVLANLPLLDVILVCSAQITGVNSPISG